MARYDGLIIPRSYSEYINKTDSATLQQALQQSGVLDSAPTEDSVKAVKSGGVFDALAGKQPTLTFDNVPTEDSDNPVKSGGIYDAIENAKSDLQSEIDTKQDTLTFDDTPTANSNNPVKSGGIKTALVKLGDFAAVDQEVNTGAKWLDGKPIYRMVFGGQFGGGVNSWNTTGKVINNIDTLVRGFAMRTTDKTIVNNMSFQVQNNVIFYFNPSGGAFPDTNRVCVEYTKTTD